MSFIDIGLIIINYSYSSKYLDKEFGDLPGVKDDKGSNEGNDEGQMMRTMLNASDYKTLDVSENVENIGSKLDEFKSKVEEMVKGQQIGRLHFHFSGHGTRNKDTAKKEAEVNDYCLVGSGSSGKFFPAYLVKVELLKLNPKTLTITFDSCRGDKNMKRGPNVTRGGGFLGINSRGGPA